MIEVEPDDVRGPGMEGYLRIVAGVAAESNMSRGGFVVLNHLVDEGSFGLPARRRCSWCFRHSPAQTVFWLGARSAEMYLRTPSTCRAAHSWRGAACAQSPCGATPELTSLQRGLGDHMRQHGPRQPLPDRQEGRQVFWRDAFQRSPEPCVRRGPQPAPEDKGLRNCVQNCPMAVPDLALPIGISGQVVDEHGPRPQKLYVVGRGVAQGETVAQRRQMKIEVDARRRHVKAKLHS